MTSHEEMEWVVEECSDPENDESTKAKFEAMDKISVKRINLDCDSDMRIIKANNPITSLEYQYFEIRLRVKENYDTRMAVGIATKEAIVDGWPGTSESEPVFAYHWDDGKVYAEGSQRGDKGGGSASDDVVGCGIDSYGFCYIVVNGKRLSALQDDPSCKVKAKSIKRKIVYPFVAVGNTDTEIVANFGQEKFVYDLSPKTFFDHWMKQLRLSKDLGDNPFLQDFHDMTIVSRDEEEIPCHKLVLSLRSNVFKNMIKSQEDGKLKIDGYDASTIKRMINFMYQDVIECEDEDSNNFTLLEMAKEYEVHDLQQLFGKALIESISLTNVIAYWLKGRKLKNFELMRACAKYVNDNFDEFKESEEFTAMISDDNKSAIMLMVEVALVDSNTMTTRKLRELMENSEE